MELDVNGTIAANPRAEDIERALAAARFPADWYIALDDGAGRSLDAQAQADGRFYLSYGDDRTRKPETADAARVKAVYLDFLARRPAAPQAAQPIKFVPDTRPLQGKSGEAPPAWAMAVMAGIIGLVILTFAVERWSPGTVRDHVPFGTSDYFWIGLIFLPMAALVLVAIASKAFELQQAKGWVETTGHIVRSQMQVQRHRFEGEAETVKNVPAVEYEFRVGGRTVNGTRIGIGDDAIAEPEATLKRYPMGANVSVFYDPRDPRNCVLERGGPQLGKREALSGCVGGLVLLAAAGAAIWWLVTRGPDFIEARFPHANAPFSIFAACFGLVALLLFAGLHRASKRAAGWPSVRGKIMSSTVERFEETRDGHTTVSYRPAVEFAYAVNGRDYRGNQIKLLMQTAGNEAYAAKVTAKYPAGREVDVHYDPANPSNAALENPTGATWLIALVALACLALAVWQLRMFD